MDYTTYKWEYHIFTWGMIWFTIWLLYVSSYEGTAQVLQNSRALDSPGIQRRRWPAGILQQFLGPRLEPTTLVAKDELRVQWVSTCGIDYRFQARHPVLWP